MPGTAGTNFLKAAPHLQPPVSSIRAQDVFARFKAKHGTKWDLLPEKAVFQLNDTHPTIAVAEVMRLLVDVEGLAWDHAWSITTKVRGRAYGGYVCRCR